MKILQNIALDRYHTFGLKVMAEQMIEITSVAELKEVLERFPGPFFILGGGSNVLFTRKVKETILKNNIPGIDKVEDLDKEVVVRIGAGENWHSFVQWCLERDLGGVENLSLIPGTAGAAPIQNIGAYGVEIGEVFQRLEAIELISGKSRTFEKEDCRFGYRDSFFKGPGKGRFFITHVFLRLNKKPHRLNLTYGAIRETLSVMNVEHPTIQDVSRAVIAIRKSKLPDPAVLGNAGSFFKNPEVKIERIAELKKGFPEMPFFPVSSQRGKIPAGWLIEQCGWKGKKMGNAGCYEKQALVLVNYGSATGQEVVDLAHSIMDSVERRFDIRLEPEVNIL